MAFAGTGGSTPVLSGLLLALGLGIVVALVYRTSIPGRLLAPPMGPTLVMLSMVSAMIMMVIGNNLARAFSLVGALAVVRFRTGLKSPWDITFVFFALAAGIACGVMAWQVAVVGTGVIALGVIGLHAVPLSGSRGEVRIIRCDFASYEGTEGAVTLVLDRHVDRRWLVEARSLRFGETLSLRYRVVLKDERKVEGMLRELSGVEGMERVVLYADEQAMGENGD
jgi:hypothetical protein